MNDHRQRVSNVSMTNMAIVLYLLFHTNWIHLEIECYWLVISVYNVQGGCIDISTFIMYYVLYHIVYDPSQTHHNNFEASYQSGSMDLFYFLRQ